MASLYCMNGNPWELIIIAASYMQLGVRSIGRIAFAFDEQLHSPQLTSQLEGGRKQSSNSFADPFATTAAESFPTHLASRLYFSFA